MTARNSLRLYVLGNLRRNAELAVLAEFSDFRAVDRISLDGTRLDELNERIRQLRLCIEGTGTPLDRQSLEILGAVLFDFMFPGRTRRVFEFAIGSRAAHDRLSVELFVEDHALAGWPWEYLFNKEAHSFLCHEFHLVRGVFTIASHHELAPLEGKIRICVLVGVLSNNRNTTPDEESRHIRNVFEKVLANDALEMSVVQGASATELQAYLQEHQFHILHYIGHARFDVATQVGSLIFDTRSGTSFSVPARAFAAMIKPHQKDARLVFLNACESGMASADIDPARSAIAAALLDVGVPAVIATQFSIPDISAHRLSAMIYNSLAAGRSLVDAMALGRQAMQFATASTLLDWGIPVLYASEPWMPVFLKTHETPGLKAFERSLDRPEALVSTLGVSSAAAPSIKPARPLATSTNAFRVALVDLDIKAGFLPDLVDLANRSQSHFAFEVAYVPLPTGYIVTRIGRERVERPQLFIPRIESDLKHTPASLGVDRVICLTASLLAWTDQHGTTYVNYFAVPLPNANVSLVSAGDLREFAAEAEIDYSKAVLRLCLGQLLATDDRWALDYHHKTYGCPLDFCKVRHNLVKGLRKKAFDHKACRDKLRDPELLEAVDALVAL
ncbi:MAG TPA: CHAT domain-containing protein [Anaeromyxobacteraceae bacterium]|nr:CHAT domain-containing protein [Anaeromyxobacteraceae bacterium]